MKTPTPEQVKKARVEADLTQAEAAKLVHVGAATRWSEYESGKHAMSLATWELFLIKTRQRQP